MEGVFCNGPRWLPPKFAGKADLGGRLAVLGSQWIVRVCLRTASMVWDVPGKYGPHDELSFFLIQKEPATMPGSETFSPFFNADIRSPFSLLVSSRSARLSPCT